MNQQLLKEALGIEPNTRISVTKVSGGWNVRLASAQKINQTKHSSNSKSFTQILIDSGKNPYYCERCQEMRSSLCHPHHIVHKSAGGKDDADNGLFLCFTCHTGTQGVHNGFWSIEEVIPTEKLEELKQRYGF